MNDDSTDTLVLRSPAKINLFLEVLGRRDDGFHELLTIMQTIDLADEVEIRRAEPGISLEVDEPSIPTGPDNLAFRAAQLFHDAIETEPAVAISLRKRIPAGGGLGGGSSNAATVLRGLNQLHGDVLPTDHLEQLAGRLGSDIPFFVRGGTARCTGRGEIIQPLAIAPMDFTVLVMAPDLHVPTPTVYRALSPDDLAGPRRSADAMEQALTQGDYNALRKGTFNRLAAPAGRAFAPLQDLAGWLDRELRECNSLELSGSGACFFALYPDDRSAQADAERLAAQPTVEPKLRVFVTRPIWPGDSP